MSDSLQRFVFDNLDARGAIVHLEESCAAIQSTHHYPPALACLLNEFAVAACLLRDSIKIDAGVTIQLRTEGAISLIMADCMEDRRVRAIAEYDSHRLPASDSIFLSSLNQKAVLAITITPQEGDRYQGIVPIESPTLELCIEDYFARSEQLPTWFRLLANEQQAVGIAIHALPAQKILDAELAQQRFQELKVLLNTMHREEALALRNEELLTRLYHEENCRLFEPLTIEFGCVCSAQKSLDAIASLGSQEVTDLVAEQQAQGNESIVVDCHFCFQRYEFELQQVIDLVS